MRCDATHTGHGLKHVIYVLRSVFYTSWQNTGETSKDGLITGVTEGHLLMVKVLGVAA